MDLTKAQRADIEQRVDEGANFLDHVVPGWEHRVDLSKLNMGAYFLDSNGCGCVAMLVVRADYDAAMNAMLGDKLWPIWSREAQELGFGGFYDGEWVYAHEMWQEAVLERRPGVLVGGERVPA